MPHRWAARCRTDAPGRHEAYVEKWVMGGVQRGMTGCSRLWNVDFALIKVRSCATWRKRRNVPGCEGRPCADHRVMQCCVLLCCIDVVMADCSTVSRTINLKCWQQHYQVRHAIDLIWELIWERCDKHQLTVSSSKGIMNSDVVERGSSGLYAFAQGIAVDIESSELRLDSSHELRVKLFLCFCFPDSAIC